MNKENAQQRALTHTNNTKYSTTSTLEVFNNGNFGDLTVITDDKHQPWFIGSEIAKALGYKRPNDAIRQHVKPRNRGTVNHRTPSSEQQVTAINESGLYSLIMRSKIKGAEDFQEWVTGTVLPSIRKHGGYTQGQEELTPEQLMAKALLVAESTIAEKQQENERLACSITELTQQFATGISIPEFCMQLNGVSTTQTQKYLCSVGILIRVKHGYRPSSPYRDTHFKSNPYEYQKGKLSYRPLVNPKGATLLYKLYRDGELPMRKDWDGSYTTNHLTALPNANPNAHQQ